MRGALTEERGSGSILAVAIIAATLILFSLLMPVVSLAALHHRVAGSADAAALAAADVAVGIRSGNPCPIAAVVAAANSTRLADCLIDGSTATVTVSAAAPFGLTLAVRATAGRPIGASAS